MKEAEGAGAGVELKEERDYRIKQKDEKREEEEQRPMGAGRWHTDNRRQEKNLKRMKEDSTKERGRTDDEEEKVGDNQIAIQ